MKAFKQLALVVIIGIGILALSGVVVNDSLIMVDFVNRSHVAIDQSLY